MAVDPRKGQPGQAGQKGTGGEGDGGRGGDGGAAGSPQPGDLFGGGILRNAKQRTWLIGIVCIAIGLGGGWLYTGAFQREDVRLDQAIKDAHAAATTAHKLAESAEAQAARSYRAARALCALRASLQYRLDISRDFLREHPEGIPGVDPATLRLNIKNQKETVQALQVMICPAPRIPPGNGFDLEGGGRQNPSGGQQPGGGGPPPQPPQDSPSDGGGGAGGGGNGGGGNGNGGGPPRPDPPPDPPGPGPGPGPEPDCIVNALGICVQLP